MQHNVRNLGYWERLSSAQNISFVILGCFIVYVLLLGIGDEAHDYARRIKQSSGSTVPGSSQRKLDFNLFVWRRTLNDEELNFDEPGRRVLFVGDVHGMKISLDKLLSKARYDPSTDQLVHAGDIVTKGPLDGSLGVLDYMSRHNVTGVRGNHDQMVIGWRAWIDNVVSHPGGSDWLQSLEKKSRKERIKFLKELERSFKKGNRRNVEEWKRIPGDWEFMDDHYTIARKMTEEQAEYLRNLPLVLHIPRLHAFVVHAGLLPLDPRHSTTSSRQPLSHPPENHEADEEGEALERLRTRQEVALLHEIPQNQDAWNVLNMRSILKDNSISKDSKDGSAWAPLWNDIMGRCGGYDLRSVIDFNSAYDNSGYASGSDDDGHDEPDDRKSKLKITKEKPLPCYPATVVYGHAASRGLDIRRWSKGMDTGCAYGRRLTSLVLSNHQSSDSQDDEGSSNGDDSNDDDDDDHDKKDSVKTTSRKKKMPFGDGPESERPKTRFISVSCPDI